MKYHLIPLIAIIVGGCAANPDTIAPKERSGIEFRNLSCVELDTELRIAGEQRDAYVKRQKSNRNRDMWLNVLLLPGTGALTSDHEEEVADSKGKVLAIERELSRRCADNSAETATN